MLFSSANRHHAVIFFMKHYFPFRLLQGKLQQWCNRCIKKKLSWVDSNSWRRGRRDSSITRIVTREKKLSIKITLLSFLLGILTFCQVFVQNFKNKTREKFWEGKEYARPLELHSILDQELISCELYMTRIADRRVEWTMWFSVSENRVWRLVTVEKWLCARFHRWAEASPYRCRHRRWDPCRNWKEQPSAHSFDFSSAFVKNSGAGSLMLANKKILERN